MEGNVPSFRKDLLSGESSLTKLRYSNLRAKGGLLGLGLSYILFVNDYNRIQQDTAGRL